MQKAFKIACLDWGGRWNYSVEACECTDTERSRPGFSEENVEYCARLSAAG